MPAAYNEVITTSALAVLGGDILSRYVSPLWIRRAAGVLFLVLGVLFLVTRGDDG